MPVHLIHVYYIEKITLKIMLQVIITGYFTNRLLLCFEKRKTYSFWFIDKEKLFHRLTILRPHY